MMQKEILKSARTGDSCVHVKHKSGLDIYICEMKGFRSVEAVIGTKYGSINNMFRTDSDSEFTTVPEGIAHFLEHKLFENQECGVFELFAKTGANCNAYTSFDKTAYLFSCSANYQENLRILLNFVQNPYFTDENVKKEMGIIGQEIQMTCDDPDWRVMFNMLECMYHSHPVKIDIAGTKESISHITPELLYKCYNTFYDLNNMALSIAGNIDADEVLAICDECLKDCEDHGLETYFGDEPETIVKKEIRQKFDIGADIFNLGYKCRPCSGSEKLKKTAAAAIAGELLTDPSSEMYQRLLKANIINSTFSYEVFTGDGYFSLIFSGESEKSEIIRDELIAEVNRMVNEGIPEKDFRRFQKTMYAVLIRELNNVEMVSSMMLDAYLEGVSPFDIIEHIAELTAQDVCGFMKNELDSEKLVLSVVERKAE